MGAEDLTSLQKNWLKELPAPTPTDQPIGNLRKELSWFIGFVECRSSKKDGK
jgi:hypothetical protein